MKKYDVLVIGELNVDLILNNIAGFPKIGTEILARDMHLLMGSSSAIFASNLSVLGAKVAFLGKICFNYFCLHVISTLEKNGVSTEFIIRSPKHNTGATIAMNYGEERAMVTHPGAMEYLTFNDITIKILEQFKHVHISSIFLQPGIMKKLSAILKLIKEHKLTTSIDTQWDPSEKWELNLKDLLPMVDVFLPNMKEFLELTRKENVDDAFSFTKAFANTIAVKKGNKGSIGYKDEQKLEMPPFLNRNVIDAIGAGDSFNAGFILKFIQNESIEKCLEFGNIVGAISTTAAGGTKAFNSIESIKKIAKERFGYIIDR